MTAPSLKQQTAKGLFWGAFSNGVQQIIGVGFGIWLARILDADDYGLVGMLAIFVAIGHIVVTSGFVVTLTNKKDVTQRDYDAVFWFMFFTGLIIYVILFFCAPWIADFYERPELVDLSRVLFAGIFINGLGVVSHTVLFKNMMTKERSIVDVASILVSFAVSIVVALQGYAYWAIVVQRMVQYTLGAILRFSLAPWRPSFKIDFSPLKQLFPFSSKLFFASVFTEISNNIFSVLLGKFYNAEQVGFYAQGQKWMTIGSQFTSGMIEYVTQPVLVQVNDDQTRQTAILRKLIRLGAFISFPLLLGLAFIGNEFIQVALGEKWMPSVPFLQLFCIWGAIRFLWNLYAGLVCAKGKVNLHLYGTIAVGAMQLIAVIIASPLGIFPMVIVYITCSLLGLLIWQRYVTQLIGLRFRDMLRDVLPYLGITLVCFAITWLLTRNIVNLYGLIVSKIMISGLLYIGILKYSKSVIFQESVAFLWERFKRKKK